MKLFRKMKAAIAVMVCTAIIAATPNVSVFAATTAEWLVEPSLVFLSVYCAGFYNGGGSEGAVAIVYTEDASSEGGVKKYINSKGEFVEYDESARNFYGGAFVDWGESQIVGEDGSVIVPKGEYDNIYSFFDGVAVAKKGEEIFYLNPKGEVVPERGGPFMKLSPKAFNPEEDNPYATTERHYVDETGKEAFPLKFDQFIDSSSGIVAGVRVNELWGVIDGSGNFVVPAEYETMTAIFNDLALMGKDGKFGIVKFSSTDAPAPAPVSTPAPAPAPAPAPTPVPATDELVAKPTASPVTVDGNAVDFDAYNINGNNFFKLRDIAYTLNGTEKQFEIGFDSASNAISITTGNAYTVAGGEMAARGTEDKTAVTSTSSVFVNGEAVTLTAYNINNNNYFKLRDLGDALGFVVDYDAASKTIIINTK